MCRSLGRENGFWWVLLSVPLLDNLDPGFLCVGDVDCVACREISRFGAYLGNKAGV
jgi:hypothetical protein